MIEGGVWNESIGNGETSERYMHTGGRGPAWKGVAPLPVGKYTRADGEHHLPEYATGRKLIVINRVARK